MLPQKTFLVKDCVLYESDFDVTSNIKMHRLMELIQDAATSHADELGFGWDAMDNYGLFWILSKVKFALKKPINRSIRSFKLYTWPIVANKRFIERRFAAVDVNGERLFDCSTIWMILNRDTRAFASQEVISRYYKADFDDTECACDTNYDRLRRDDSYVLQYQRQIRRTDLDINKHVNNTNYINFALDVLDEQEQVSAVEIVYHKELKLGDVVNVYAKREDNCVSVVGEREQICFSVKLTLVK